MISEDLPFRRNFDAMDKAFPQDYRTILIVIDGKTAAAAQDAAEKLYAALTSNASELKSVFYPEADPFFRRHGLLYLSVDQLSDLADKLAQSQPFIASLASDPSLRGLASVLSLALTNVSALSADGEALPSQLDRALSEVTEAINSVKRGNPTPVSWRGLLVSEQPDPSSELREIIVLEPKLDFASLAPAEQALGELRGIISQLGLTEGGDVRVRLTGELLMLQDELQSVRQNISLVGGISFALVLCLLGIGLRSVRLFFSTF